MQSPSMTSLRAFEAVARHGSLTGAARELCVTPAAISHRIKDLEAIGSEKLLRRSGGQFRPTAHGRRVLGELGDAFDRIRNAHGTLLATQTDQITVVASYSFAVAWLLPHLSMFPAADDSAAIAIHPSHEPLEAAGPRRSVTIVHSGTRPDGTGWRRLFDDVCGIVAAPDHPIFALSDPISSGALSAQTLVHVTHDVDAGSCEFSWAAWAHEAGCSGASFPIGVSVSAEHAALDLVQAQSSLALVSLINADRLLTEGRLACVPGSARHSGKAYWMREEDSSSGGAFADWLAVRTAEVAARY